MVSLYISNATFKKMNLEKKIDTKNIVRFKVHTNDVKKYIKELEATSYFYLVKESLMVISNNLISNIYFS